MENSDKLSQWLKELDEISKKKKEIDKTMQSQGIETLIKDK
jgi:hypothetical protein|tara:strand:- start:95 stop:217 length:123 start_codon:yes stop_codon:yes gene_type:complete